jgi:hypothetical protein
MVRLQVVQELQAAAPLVTTGATPASAAAAHLPSAGPGRLRELLDFWEARLGAMASSLHALEPAIALHVCIRKELAAARVGDGGPAAGVLQAAPSAAELQRGLGASWLRLAKSARAAGNPESAANALMQARLHAPTLATLASAKMEWAAGQPHDAMARLRQQRARLEGALPDRATGGEREALGATVLMLARFSDEAGELEAEEVMAMHVRVVELCPSWEKGHYWLGRFHDTQLRRALDAAARREVEVPATHPGQMSCPAKRVVTPKERERKKIEAHATHLAPMIRCYGQALQKGAKHAPSVLPRVLTSWLDYADNMRNQLVVQKLQQMFKTGRVSGMTGQAEPTGAHALEPGFELPVFTVSAMDYQKIEGLRPPRDGAPRVWTEAEQTLIPELKTHVSINIAKLLP